MILLLLAACRPPGPEVLGAQDLGPIEQSAAIQGRDGGSSALAWGRSIWVYGDTVLNVLDEDGQNWHHNSVSFTEDLDAADQLDSFWEPLDSAGAPAHLVAPSEEEQAFNLAHAGEDCPEQPCGARWAVWPGAPVWDEDQDRAVLFYGLIYAEPGDFNFEGVGSSIATWTDPEGLPQRPIIDADAAHPDLMWGAEAPGWGQGAVFQGDHLYTMACDNTWTGHGCVLGRVDRTRVQDPAAWRVWTGRDWQADADRADRLYTGGSIQSLSWNAYLDAWLVVYSRPSQAEVVARSAPELTGPWSKESLLFTDDSDPYDAQAHAEYEEDDGRVIYVSFTRGTEEGWFGRELRLVRVEFE